MKLQRNTRQRGDTLVEVLICILIVSLILTGAYVTTNRSSLRVRDSQEQAEALKLAQSQLEQVRQNARSNNANVFAQPDTATFCMAAGQPIAADDARCRLDGAAQPATEAPAYRLAVRRAACTAGPGCHSFTVTATWDSVVTGTQATQQLRYRVHQQ